MDAITERILTQLGDKDLIAKLLALPKPDLTSLLMRLFRGQAGATRPSEVLKAFESNRFCVPSEFDPAAYHAMEAEWLTLAKKLRIQPVLLSPAAPLGSCSTFGCVDQNNVVSAVRGVEILADPTNMLAIYAAGQLKSKAVDNETPLHYCTTARVLRTQVFPAMRGFYAHFGIFCMVSSGKDGGSYGCEKSLLVRQLSYYKALLIEKYGAKLSVVLRKRQGYSDGDGFFERMAEVIRQELSDVPLAFDLEHEDNAYYKGANFKLFMEQDDGKMEIGDGGFVDWMQQMTGSKKQRCLISGISLDRLLL